MCPPPKGAGTIFYRGLQSKAPAGGRIQFVSPRPRGNFLFSSLRDYCIIKYGTGRAVVPALFRVDNLWGRKGGASCANGPFLSVGAAAFGGPRRSPARLPPFRGKLSAARLTDEGAHGNDAPLVRPLIRHLLCKCHLPPCGGKAKGRRRRRPLRGTAGAVLYPLCLAALDISP